MKRKVTLLAVVLLFCISVMGLSVNAGTQNVSEQAEGFDKPQMQTTQFPIRAMLVKNSELLKIPVIDKEGAGTLPDDGTVIETDQAPDGAVYLVVRKIKQTETEAYAWFKTVLTEQAETVQAYEIYFLKENGERLPADGAKIRITAPASVRELQICSVTESSTSQKLQSVIINGKAEFVTDGSRYYVLTDAKTAESEKQTENAGDNNQRPAEDTEDNSQKATEDTGDSSENSTENKENGAYAGGLNNSGGSLSAGSDSIRTGDDTNLMLWIVLAVISAGVVLFLLLFRKKKL